MPTDTRLLEALRATLFQLESSAEGCSDPSSLAALKSILLRRIADLEGERDSDDAEAVDKLTR